MQASLCRQGEIRVGIPLARKFRSWPVYSYLAFGKCIEKRSSRYLTGCIFRSRNFSTRIDASINGRKEDNERGLSRRFIQCFANRFISRFCIGRFMSGTRNRCCKTGDRDISRLININFGRFFSFSWYIKYSFRTLFDNFKRLYLVLNEIYFCYNIPVAWYR